ncbi:hypothetical protein HW452_05270 [Halomonas aquamarina]|uniref:Uncharacterized protein n=1 Tax=Vreelandella aquamarina TaxID=77097 RepID=A0ACC5VS78_9GAMM|nr:hypothetical protein [Halomonas aquamarina]MBZ5486932.1 hypothetical protein [Halomonas aquamarina]
MPLTKQDAEALLETVYATAELLGTEIRPATANMMIRDLRPYDRAEIEQSLTRCRAELSGRLTLAAVLERIPSAQQYLLPNEAWSVALQSLDEMDTIIWTQETAAAMGVARPIMEQGDKVGARMAFIAAYEREVGQAKAEGRAPEYTVSLGESKERRQEAISQGIKKGLLAAPKVKHLLPAPHGFKEPDESECPEKKARAQANIDHLRSLLVDDSSSKQAAEKERRRQEEARRQQLIEQAEQRQRGAA